MEEKSLEARLFEALRRKDEKGALDIINQMNGYINGYYRGKSSLYWAMIFKVEKVINTLKKMGADEANTEIDKKIYERNGRDLLKAIRDAKFKEAFDLIEAGADLSLKSEDGYGALISALNFKFDASLSDEQKNILEKERLKVIRTLIDARAKLNECDDKGRTPLMIACEKGYTDIASKMIRLKADKNAKDSSDWTALMFAAKNGNIEIVREFVKTGVDINAKNDRNVTALMLAAVNGHTEIVEELLKAKNSIDIDATNEHGSALSIAARSGKVGATKALIDAGADIEIRDSKGNTVFLGALKKYMRYCERLSEAKRCNDIEAIKKEEEACIKYLNVIKTLIDAGADVNAVDLEGNNALLIATKNNDAQIVKMLVKAGADADAKKIEWCNLRYGEEGEIIKRELVIVNTPLLTAFCKSNWDMFGDLVSAGANINTHYKYGETLLHEAVIYNNIEAVEMLFKHGCNDAEVNGQGDTPIMHAHRNRNDEIFNFLLEKGSLEAISTRDRNGFSLLTSAIMSNNVELVKTLLDKGVRLDLNSELDGCVFMEAIQEGKDEIVKELIERGLDVNQKNEKGESLLLRACSYDYWEADVVKKLIEYGADVDELCVVTDYNQKRSRTPLMVACEKGRVDIINTLIEAGADVDMKNNRGRTAIEFVKDEKTRRAYRNAVKAREDKKNGKSNTNFWDRVKRDIFGRK